MDINDGQGGFWRDCIIYMSTDRSMRIFTSESLYLSKKEGAEYIKNIVKRNVKN